MAKLLLHLRQILQSRGCKKLWLGVALLAGFWLAPLVVSAATFTASLDRDTITFGESATLSLSFGGAQPQGLPSLPEIPNLRIGYQGQSSQFNMAGGQTTSTISYNFSVTPQQPGDYTIPGLAVNLGGEKLSSQPLTLKVLKPNAPSAEAVNSGSQLAFLKWVLPKKQMYVGEVVTAQLQIYLQSRVARAGDWQVTSFPANGFVAGTMVQTQGSQVQVGNSIYNVHPLVFTLKAVSPGALTLGPLTANLVVELPSNNRQRDPYDPFGFFGSRNEQKQLSLVAEAESIQVLPLPRENVPPTFNGAVGNYTLAVTAGPTNVATGDPITVKVKISGRGSIDTLTLPEQPAWRDFKTIPPTSTVQPSDQLGLQGAKTFEQVIVPQTTDIKALPAVSFSFFDPDQKIYRTLTQPAIPLVVRPGGVASVPMVLASSRGGTQEAPPPTQDIVPLKQRLGAVAQIGPPLVRQTWFLALQGIPVLALVSAVLWRKRVEAFANNPRLRRQRQVAQLVRQGLQDLRQLAAANKSEEFFATLSRLLQEQLGERLDLPASAITEAVIAERLRPRGAPESLLVPLEELFQTCNLARYAPLQSSQELAALIPKLEKVLQELQEVKV